MTKYLMNLLCYIVTLLPARWRETKGDGGASDSAGNPHRPAAAEGAAVSKGGGAAAAG